MASIVSANELMTAGQISLALGESMHRVRYVLGSRPSIQPVRRVGLIRVYDASVVELVRLELAGIDKRGRST